MHAQHTPNAAQLPASRLIIALTRADADTQAAAARFIMMGARYLAWFRSSVERAVNDMMEEQQALDRWVEIEEEKLSNRYACESMKY